MLVLTPTLSRRPSVCQPLSLFECGLLGGCFVSAAYSLLLSGSDPLLVVTLWSLFEVLPVTGSGYNYMLYVRDYGWILAQG